MCRTRWIQQIDVITTFFELYLFVVQTIQAMSTRSCPEWGWDGESVTKASGFLQQMESFEFIVAASITMRLLSSFRLVTVSLQKHSSNIFKAYTQLSDVELDLELLKLNGEQEFHIWFEELAKFAQTLAVDVSACSQSCHETSPQGKCPGT